MLFLRVAPAGIICFVDLKHANVIVRLSLFGNAAGSTFKNQPSLLLLDCQGAQVLNTLILWAGSGLADSCSISVKQNYRIWFIDCVRSCKQDLKLVWG